MSFKLFYILLTIGLPLVTFAICEITGGKHNPNKH